MSQRNLIIGFRSPGIRIRTPFVELESQLRDLRNLAHPTEGRFGYRVSEKLAEDSMTTYKLRVLNHPLVDKNQHPVLKVQTYHNSQNQGRIIIQSESKQRKD